MVIVRGTLGTAARMGNKEWNARQWVYHPADYEDRPGRLAYCYREGALYAGEGYPLEELAPLLNISDMDEATSIVDSSPALSGLSDKAKDILYRFLAYRLRVEQERIGRERAEEWLAKNDYVAIFDAADSDTADPDTLRALLAMCKGDLCSVYTMGYIAGWEAKQ